ncbi:MAG: hypothetical protein RBT11_14090 [Desulfobacterales bacterium]|jgi:hypothetical protein|nr:hypothetical protein [Desulfobacterales bacterium]
MQQASTINFQTNHGTVNVYTETPYLAPIGKCDRDQNVKLDSDLMKWLDDIAAATNEGRSTVARQAIIFFKYFYPIHKKILRYRKTIQSMLETLP